MTDTSKLVRLTVNLTPRSAAALDLAVGLTRDSKTDTINRALQVYAYLMSLKAEGREITARGGGKPEETIIIL
jgi:hypothetical protein